MEIATIDEWNDFIKSDGFYTAPEFLVQKFYIKTLKTPPPEIMDELTRAFTEDEDE